MSVIVSLVPFISLKQLKSQSERLWLGKDPNKIENSVLNFLIHIWLKYFENSIFKTEFSILLGPIPTLSLLFFFFFLTGISDLYCKLIWFVS